MKPSLNSYPYSLTTTCSLHFPGQVLSSLHVWWLLSVRTERVSKRLTKCSDTQGSHRLPCAVATRPGFTGGGRVPTLFASPSSSGLRKRSPAPSGPVPTIVSNVIKAPTITSRCEPSPLSGYAFCSGAGNHERLTMKPSTYRRCNVVAHLCLNIFNQLGEVVRNPSTTLGYSPPL